MEDKMRSHKLNHRLRLIQPENQLKDIGIAIFKENKFKNKYTNQIQTEYVPDQDQSRRIFNIIRKIKGPDQVIVTPFGELSFERKYFSHAFFNVVAKNRPNTGVERMTCDYKTRIALCGFFNNKKLKYEPKDFYTDPSLIDLDQEDQKLTIDIQNFLTRNPYA